MISPRGAIFLIVGSPAALALALETPGYIPLATHERLTRSGLFVGTMGILVAAVVALCVRIVVGRPAERSRYFVFSVVVLTCVVVGSALAATDTRNENARNPALCGSFALTPVLPAAILLLQPRRAVGSWIIALLFTPPFCIALLFLFSFVQAAGFNLAW
jgi:hypothetical protein